MVNLRSNLTPITLAVESGLLPGAVTLVYKDDKVLQHSAIGYRNLEMQYPMQPDTIFRIMSMSKPVTSATALTLLDEGKLALEDPVTRWLPEFSDMRIIDDPAGPLSRTHYAKRPITVDDLLTHRSGLASSYTSTGELSRRYKRLSAYQDPDVWLTELAELPLLYQPGDQPNYSHSTDVLGILISRIEGKPLHIVMSERIFDPLGMSDTGFFVQPNSVGRVAMAYTPGSAHRLQRVMMAPAPVSPPAFCQGGEGLLSTAEDYLRFAKMLLKGGAPVLSTESTQLMLTDRLTTSQKQVPYLDAVHWVGRGFGLGLMVVTDPAAATPVYGPGGVGAFGWPGALGTWWQADPQRDLVVIALTQRQRINTAMEAKAAVDDSPSQKRILDTIPEFVKKTYAEIDAAEVPLAGNAV